MARVLITGVNGFIGSHLAEKFLQEGHEVIGFVRRTSDLSLIKDMNLQLRYGDIRDVESLRKAFSDIECVVHNAGIASDWGSLESFRKVNLEGTQRVAEAAKFQNVKRIVQMSSTAIHGFGHTDPLSEDGPFNPVFNYSISKMEAEQWIMGFGKENDIAVSAIRPGNVFGERDHTFIEKYIEAILSKKIAYVNRGQSMTCPTYVRNLAQGVYLASQHEKAIGEAFIITDGLKINWKDFTEALADELGVLRPSLSIPLWLGLPIAGLVENTYKLVGSKTSPLITKYRMYNGGTDYHFNIEKAKKLLGFKPEYDLEIAIKNTSNWYKEKYKL
ncbi:MAG: NAD-dependent epimerase/dehydratase family protein [Saprospiraceae bacterium]|nr:NAD-dependent epimerase/dehydratase family protein [Saprospiraceae bacterium]